MSAPVRRVCLVTPGYLSSTPRVVREADALEAAGYDVRVVHSSGGLDALRDFDDELAKDRRWRTSSVGWSNGRGGERVTAYRSAVRQRVAAGLMWGGLRTRWAIDRAEGRLSPELARLAAAEPADLYIGHYPAGLAAARAAADRHGAVLGYDIEDLYAETCPPGPVWNVVRKRIIELERRHVPRCAHLSAVSEPVADAFARRYGTRTPTVVHNCHPWADRERIDGRVLERRGPALSLFWFSQTVGLDRGIQEAIRAAGLLRRPVQIHLRGFASDHVRRELTELAVSCGLVESLYFHPTCAPSELLSRAVEHDVGLALESDGSLNRRLTVANKLFLYLTAGLAVAATDTAGQRTILETCPDAGQLHGQGDLRALASHLDTWARDETALARAREAALAAARTRYDAAQEGERLAGQIEAVLRSRESPLQQGA